MLNHITIMGRLTRDPELRRTQSGVAVTSFTVAVDRDYTSEGGERGTDFIDCVSWRQGGEFVANYFRKGSMIVVDGRLQSRKWQDRDGNNRTSWEIVTDHTYFGEAKRDSSSAGSYSAPSGSYGGSQSQAPQDRPATGAGAVQPPEVPERGGADGDIPF